MGVSQMCNMLCKARGRDLYVAQMCSMHCKAGVKGLVHLTPCPDVRSGCCTERLFDGARHLKIKCSGLDVDVPLDEMTHQAY